MRLSVLRGGNRKSEKDAGQGLSGSEAIPFSPASTSTASVKLLPKNSMTKSTGPPPLLWLCLYHLFPRTVKLSCRFQRYSCPARVSCSPCDCRKKQGRRGWRGLSVLGCNTWLIPRFLWLNCSWSLSIMKTTMLNL